MAKSSIHIESGNMGFFSHNDRTRPTKNSIFSDEENFHSCSSKDAIKHFKSEFQIRSEVYKNRTGQKLQKNAITHLAAIVNLNSNHDENDLQKICDYLEDTFDTKVVQFSIHRDEGHISTDGKAIKNYHAHIEFLGLDSQGQSVRKKLDRKALMALQSATAELLQMQRGRNYTAEQAPRPKRLDTYDWKAHKERESESILVKSKDLKAEIKQLREQLQEAHAGREDYRRLEELNRELKEQVKLKDLTVEQLQERLSQHSNKSLQDTKTLQDELDHTKSSLSLSELLNDNLSNDNEDLKQENLLLRKKIELLESEVIELKQQLQSPMPTRERQAKRKELNQASTEIKQHNQSLKQQSEATREGIADGSLIEIAKSEGVEIVTQDILVPNAITDAQLEEMTLKDLIDTLENMSEDEAPSSPQISRSENENNLSHHFTP